MSRILGGEGGGHTGDIPFSILIPACVDAAKGRKSPLTGEQVMVVAAGIRYLLALDKKVAYARLQEVFQMAGVSLRRSRTLPLLPFVG